PQQLAELNAGLQQKVEALERAEVALRTSEERFRTAFEFAGVGVAIVGLDGRWLQINRRLTEIVGTPEAELLRSTLRDLMHPADFVAVEQQMRVLREGQRPFFSMERRLINRNGLIVWGRMTTALVRDPAGAAVHFVVQI